jgi:iron complex outermembrane receptor protein
MLKSQRARRALHQMRVWFASMAGGILLLNGVAAAAIDFSRQQHFDIASQPLPAALVEFSRQAGVQFTAPGAAISAVHSAGVQGEYAADTALRVLLRDTGFTFRIVDEGTVAITSAAAESAVTRPSPNEGSKEASGDDAKGAQKRSFWDRFRLAQVDRLQAPNESSANGRSNDEQSSKVKLEEIVVTAQKREERLIDVPQSVSVLSSGDLAKLGATQFRDYANTIPGLSFTTQGAGLTQISLRGVTTGIDVGPTVGIYVDDVPYGSSTVYGSFAQLAFDANPFDLDRIEVLRGPQGTLYGASSMGGVLKYVSKRPDATDFGGDVQAGISSTQDGGLSYNVSAAVNAPIVTDKVAVRANGFESHDGGYFDNTTLDRKDVDRADIYGGRLDLLFTPTDALSIRVDGFLQNISRDGYAVADYGFGGAPLSGSLDQSRQLAEPFDQRFRLVSGALTYKFGAATLTSISSYQKASTQVTLDQSALLVPVFGPFFGGPFSAMGTLSEYDAEKFTQEVRLSGEGSWPIEWVIGGFYTHEISETTTSFTLVDLAGQPAPNNLLTISFPSRYKEYAAFGDVTWHLSSKFDVTGGIRRARDDQTFRQDGSGILGSSHPSRNSNESVTTYLANARYHFTDNALVYLRYATGYRPGGPNFVPNDPVTGLPIGPTTFAADRLKSYEAGYKAQTLDRRLGIDLAVYYTDWRNPQLVTVLGNTAVFVNASGGATIKGAELTLTARPNSSLAVTAAFAYQDASLNDAEVALGASKGERLPNVPRFTAALNGDYSLTEGGLRPTLGATVRHASDRTAKFGLTAPPQYYLPEYTMVDLRASITFGAVDAQLYVRNLFDEHAQLSAVTSGTVTGAPYVGIAAFLRLLTSDLDSD